MGVIYLFMTIISFITSLVILKWDQKRNGHDPDDGGMILFSCLFACFWPIGWFCLGVYAGGKAVLNWTDSLFDHETRRRR